MKISFNPSNSNKNILDLIKNNKDIIFDLKGHSIFARGVEFKGTDTNTWRPVVDNLTSDSTTSSLSAKQGKVLKALIDGKSNSDHNHDGRYLKLTGGTMASNALITFADSGSWDTSKKPQGARGGLYWTGQSDYAKLYAEETVRDNLDLVIQFGDDNSNGLSIRNKANTQTSYISSSGVITTGTFKGNLDWSYITNKPATATRWPSWAEVTGKPSSFTPSTHTHGLSNSVFFLNMPSINGNAKWKEVFGYPVNYNLLLSVRINDPAPEWCVGNFGSGILYGGNDTKGFMSSAYNEPFIMWAGGNGSSDDSVPKWYIGIKGTHKSIYNLATIASEANAAYNLRHSHANKSVLDGITSALVNSWNTAYNFAKNSGINGSTIKLNGTSITVYSSGTADDRYVKKSEVNSLLDAKLNRQNLSYGNWNPRGYHLAADYHYNGGDLSISESGGQIHVSVDGYFWQNEGQYRVLDTSDIGDIRDSVTLHQYLSATDAAWYPLVWGGDSHNNTSDSTGRIYKSHDKLCWQTSSQTLYATNIQTNNIKNLSIGGGIYWNPNVESATDGSDAASITLVRSGVAGGTTLVLSQMNDTNDTIQFKTNTAARLYHNSYPILTTQNTYVSNNKGYINGLEITQVNNADTVDGEHASNFSYTHQSSFDFSKRKSGRIVTFDQSGTGYGWINGFASTHNNYLTSVIFNGHRSSNWYVGYMEGDMSTGETNGLQAVHKLAFADGDESYPIFLGYLNLYNGNDGTISSSFPCLGYSVPFTYTRGGAYCFINIPDTSFQTFYIKAAIASVHYSGAGMGNWVGNHRGDGAWWLHCDAVGSNAVQVKGFHLANGNNDSWWGGNPLYSGNGAAKIITVCLFGHVKYK